MQPASLSQKRARDPMADGCEPGTHQRQSSRTGITNDLRSQCGCLESHLSPPTPAAQRARPPARFRVGPDWSRAAPSNHRLRPPRAASTDALALGPPARALPTPSRPSRVPSLARARASSLLLLLLLLLLLGSPPSLPRPHGYQRQPRLPPPSPPPLERAPPTIPPAGRSIARPCWGRGEAGTPAQTRLATVTGMF